ncbi:hypothetical protein M0802_014297 [Mischocyttarus mexicanus]|nr:hypothetical protein M0802_014297 [Mischocyttarus mexicanus]
MSSKKVENLRSGGSHSTAMQAGALAGRSSSSSYDCHVLKVGNLVSGLDIAPGRRRIKDIRLEDILTKSDQRNSSPFSEQAAGNSKAVTMRDVSPASTEVSLGKKKKNSMRLTSSFKEEWEINARIDSEEEVSEYMEMTRLLDRVIGHFESIEEARKTCGNLKGEMRRMKKNAIKENNVLQLIRRKILKTEGVNKESEEIKNMKHELRKIESRNRLLEEANKAQANELKKLRKGAVEVKPAETKAAPLRVVDVPQTTASSSEATDQLEGKLTSLIQKLSEKVGEIKAHLGLGKRKETLPVAVKRVRATENVQPTVKTK